MWRIQLHSRGLNLVFPPHSCQTCQRLPLKSENTSPSRGVREYAQALQLVQLAYVDTIIRNHSVKRER